MNKVKYRCIEDPDNKYHILNKVKTCDQWKEEARTWFTDNHSFAYSVNLEALSGKDVLEYLGYICKVKFQLVEEEKKCS